MKKYALLGRGIDYSFSPTFFNSKFIQLGIDKSHEYSLLDTPNLEDIRNLVLNLNLSGFNVTQPYKEQIIPFLDSLSKEAEEIGAVNCVKIENGKLIGYNTDAFGFKQMIKPFLENDHSKALILGRGGASKAIAHVLKELGIDYFYVRRQKDIGESKELEYTELAKPHLDFFQLIINTSPVGTFPEVKDKPNIPYQFLTEKHFLIDLIYNPEKTSFLKEGFEKKSKILNGKDMLLWQAEKSWEIWNN